MRTDTKTFRRNAFKALRRQGVNSVKSREIADQLVWQLRWTRSPTLPDTARIVLEIDREHAQSVAIVDGPSVLLHLDVHALRQLQPLANCTPTERQVAIGAELSEMIPDVYAAIGDACDAWEEVNGHRARVDGDDEDRAAFTRAFPAVVAINARYDALKAESLAINPRVECSLVDPDKASHWYEWVKDYRGYRPQGFHTLADVEEDLARLANERPYDEEPALAA